MVKKLSLPVLLLIAILTAAACKFFAVSLFPAYLTQISAFVDLSKEMDGFIGSAGEDFDCRLFVLKNSFDGKVKAEFPVGDDYKQIETYDTEGEYYYHLDVRGRRLYKCGTWW